MFVVKNTLWGFSGLSPVLSGCQLCINIQKYEYLCNRYTLLPLLCPCFRIVPLFGKIRTPFGKTACVFFRISPLFGMNKYAVFASFTVSITKTMA